MSLRPTILYRDGASLDPAEFAYSPQKRGGPCALSLRAGRAHVPDNSQRAWVLGESRDRPRSRAAEKRDQLAPVYPRVHSITSSARASSAGGTSRPDLPILSFMDELK